MKPASVKWRDWDWDGDPYTPGRISTPGRLIFCMFDLWEEMDAMGFYPETGKSVHAPDRIIDVYAAALLNPAQTFILWTAHPERAAKFMVNDLFAPYVQRRAADVMQTLAGVADRPEFPVRPINPRTGKQYTAAEAAIFAAFYGQPFAEACAGLGVPQGTPLLPNVWLGVRLSGRDKQTHIGQIATLGTVPATVRFLFLSNGCECEFEPLVWGERYEPIPVPSPGQGWKAFEDGETLAIDTRRMPFRRLDWVICGGINTAAVEYHAAQAIETGTPYWVEAAGHLPLDFSVQLWPAQAEREPHLLPEQAAELRRRLMGRKADGTI
jgi:hypothetical protein